MAILFIFSFLCLISSAIYLLIVFNYLSNWKKLKVWEIPSNYRPQTKFTVIIPVRNEGNNIHDCLKSILNQNYPTSLFHIIVVDDHSTDDTLSIVNSFKSNQVRILSLEQFELPITFNSFKKFGIEKAIEQADGDLLIHTDGDCIVQKNWLAYFASHFEMHNKSFIAGPVNFHSGENGIQNFQELDMMGMMLITGAGVQNKKGHLCNGANLAYTKALFQSIGGFKDINKIASGDDVLLMHKIAKKFPNEIAFLKNPKARVFTQSAKNWSKFKQQRIRWATKSSSYEDKSVQLSLIGVFIFHLGIVFSLAAALIFDKSLAVIFILMLVAKLVADYSLLKRATKFFNNEEAMLQFAPSFFIHIYYIVYIGILANLKGSYEWKGRKVS